MNDLKDIIYFILGIFFLIAIFTSFPLADIWEFIKGASFLILLGAVIRFLGKD